MSETTGTEILRRALFNRAHKGHLANLSRDLGIGIAALEAFSRGEGKLPPEILQALAREFFNGAELDLDRDLLRHATRPEPRVQGPGAGPIWEWMELPKFKGGPIEHAHRPHKPEPVVAQRQRRPGWAEE